ncbi:uncharacterized protein LOC125657187 [Ostrea edulis]|uniref:uncharacterized protein LOC125657187 n=1 Tax=Ostrea edulis TaxID=37623 RepID=UPI0024AFF85C|nr:uncharacterized protein LOC125657187 [Ostrea edulis]
MSVFCVKKAVLLLCFASTISAVMWPGGSYTLLKPDTGCPPTWLDGWRYQDNENNNNSNSISFGHHFFGIIEEKPINLNFSFCTKNPQDVSDGGQWPSGSYCIMRHGETCPPGGFENGSIFWDDENDKNKNSAGGVLPSGQYDKDTMINYCCRKDGNFTTPIQLPASLPFHLLRFNSPCQAVKGMNSRELRINFDDENENNKDHAYGSHPYGPRPGKKDNALVYCYYNPI